MENSVERGPDWVGIPVIATVARLLCRELTLQNEYLRLENRILKEKVPGRIHFTDEERRSLVQGALALGRSLMKDVVNISSSRRRSWPGSGVWSERNGTTVNVASADRAGPGHRATSRP